MTRRWEARRAEASARWSDVTSSVVQERLNVSGARTQRDPDSSIASAGPSTQSVLADLQQLELNSAAASGVHASGSKWLQNTNRAMLAVALVSSSALLALLYFGGFLG